MGPVRTDRLPVSAPSTFLLIFFLFGFSYAAAAEEGTVRVEPVRTEGLETAPGEVVTAVFRITNDGPEACTFVSELDLPGGWRPVLPMTDFAVPAGEEDTRLVTFRVPAETPAGRYPVRLSLRARHDAGAMGEGVLYVTVLPVYALSLEALEAPRYVRAGTSYEASFLLSNRGNTGVAADLRLQSEDGFAAETDSVRLHLPARASRRFTVRVTTPDELDVRRRHLLRVEAAVRDHAAAVARAARGIDVIPGSGVLRGRYPLQMTFGAVGDGGGGGPLLALSGTGAFWDGELALRLRMPDQQTASRYGRRSEYGLGFQREDLAIQLGDGVYRLSPLTEAGRYGFGVGGHARRGRFTLGGFVQQSRYGFPRETQRGTQVTYALSERTDLQASLLSRDGLIAGESVSLRASVIPARQTGLDAECGLGTGGGARQEACMLMLHGRRPRLAYTLRYIHASPHFPGYYRHLDAKAVSLNLQPLPWLRFQGSWRDYRQGYEAGPDRPEAVRTDRTFRLGSGVTGRLREATAFFHVGIEQKQLRDLARGLTRARKEDVFRLRGGMQAAFGGFSGDAAIGRVRSDILTRDDRYGQVRLQAHVRPMQGQRLDAALEYYTGATLYSPVPQRRWAATLQATLSLWERTQLLLNLYGSLSQQARGYRYHYAQMRLQHRLPFGHLLELQGQYAAFGAAASGMGDYSLTYSVPLGVTVPRHEQGGAVTGRVYDAETGAPLPGVLLHLDDAVALTGADGTFVFPRPAPGTHFLHLDRLSTGLDRVPTQSMPLEVQVGAGTLPEIEVGVVRSARLTGQVELPIGAAERPDGTERPSRILLELSNPTGRYRTLADPRGRFSFEDIRPGRWTLRVVHAELPAYHQVKQERYEVVVGPGEAQAIRIRVQRQQRTIRMVDEGALSLDGAHVEEHRPAEDTLSAAELAEEIPAVRAEPDEQAPEEIEQAPDGGTSPTHTLYMVRKGDCLSCIARDVYGDLHLWPKIYLANRDQIEDPDRIEPGQQLALPAEGPLTPEERHIRRAYRRAGRP